MRRRIRSVALPVHRHALLQIAVDAVLVALSYFLAFHLRFDSGLPGRYDDLFRKTVVPLVIVGVVVLALLGAYQRWWRYTTPRDYQALVGAGLVIVLVLVSAIALIHPVTRPPHESYLAVPNDRTFTALHAFVDLAGVHLSVHPVKGAPENVVSVGLPTGVAAAFLLLLVVSTSAIRFLAVWLRQPSVRGFRARKDARNVLIVGAGEGGQLVLREMIRNAALGYRPVGFVDDDPRKQGMRLEKRLKVLGSTGADFPRVLDDVEPDEVIIAIPSAPGTLRARVLMACRERGIPVRTTPTVFEMLRSGAGMIRQVRDVQVEDVLGREPVRMELERVGAYLRGQVVLVTGAGGSIGGELSRQIARTGVRRLVLVDHAEDNLFEITRELEEERHVRVATPVLADCKEEERMREVLAEHRPSVVFHAAAYKHVGMMESNPVEAVRNNALATRLMARIVGEGGVGAFVLVSTDKAVSPATVMGASKALAEWAVEAAAMRWPETRFATVRFGNVLGSSGSVVPIFRRQIAHGGPVTVTDPRMTRYFMTIPEAVQLIIRAGSLTDDGSGKVYVLDMGDPVRIMDLAEQMIRLSGLEPERDIAIEVVGVRGGEKLGEELFNPYEHPQPTPAQKIQRAEHEPLDPAWVESTFAEINLLVLEGDAAALAAKVGELAAVRAAPSARIAP
jgi:FlaA1/EpsC-like NDP-sugar epimerase